MEAELGSGRRTVDAGEEGRSPAARAQCHPELSSRCLSGAQPGVEDLKLKMGSVRASVERLPGGPRKDCNGWGASGHHRGQDESLLALATRSHTTSALLSGLALPERPAGTSNRT